MFIRIKRHLSLCLICYTIGFCSMWLSNTATAVMMMPLSKAALQFIEKQVINKDRKKLRYLAAAIDLSISYR